MKCTVKEYPLAGLKLITPPKFGDNRGFFSETFNAEIWAKLGIPEQFVQDNHSLSAQKGTVRGLHYQNPPHAQAKLARVSRGSILDVVVDIRRGSPTYGQHVAVELTPALYSGWFCAWLLYLGAKYRTAIQGERLLRSGKRRGHLVERSCLGHRLAGLCRRTIVSQGSRFAPLCRY